jgi:hypothetical protein
MRWCAYALVISASIKKKLSQLKPPTDTKAIQFLSALQRFQQWSVANCKGLKNVGIVDWLIVDRISGHRKTNVRETRFLRSVLFFIRRFSRLTLCLLLEILE